MTAALRLSIRHSSGLHDTDLSGKAPCEPSATRIASLSGQPAGLTLQKRSGADHCYDFSADLKAADGTTTASVTGTITMVKEDGAWKASDLTLNLK